MNGVAQAFSRAAAAARAPPHAPGISPAHAPAAAPSDAVRDPRYALLIGAMVWTLVILMIVPDGFDYSALDNDASAPIAGSSLSRMLWLVLLGMGVAAILWRSAFAWLLVRSLNPFLLAFVVLAAASVAWSMDPPVTARRLIRVVTIVSVSIGFVLMAWHARRFQHVVRGVITAVLVGSLVFGLAWPTLAIHPEMEGVLAGAWHGLANHKNGFGDIACIGLIFWFHAWLSREGHVLPLLGMGLAATCLALSRSSTSLVATGFTLFFLVLLLRSPQTMRRSMPWIVGLFVTALLGYTLVLLQILPGLHTLLSPIGSMTGKDMTFTGRTEIWDIMFEHIHRTPYLGTGYGAFWSGSDQNAPSFEFVERLGFDPGSSHNGYLDILNDLGGLGLTVLFGYLVVFVAQSLRLLRTDRAQAALFLALFMQQAITNLAESRWFSPLSVDFVIMTLATAALARALLEHRVRGSAGTPQTALAAMSAPRPALWHGPRR